MRRSLRIELIETDLREPGPLAKWFEEKRIECVMHFAAFAYVGESGRRAAPLLSEQHSRHAQPARARCPRRSIQRLVFSSTCATYGEPDAMPIREETPQNPINPYGASKLFSERMLKDYARADARFRVRGAPLLQRRGAAEDGSLGEHHEPETHLIPRDLAGGARPAREGGRVRNRLPRRPDGTCVRDYIHVEDLVGRARVRDAAPHAGVSRL